jgi:hypothetical protein
MGEWNASIRSQSTMAFSEFEMKRCEKLVAEFVKERRPPAHLRSKVDLAFRIAGQSVEIYALRPHWLDKSKVREHPIAKTTYDNSKKHWKVFWKRADMKWHGYQPHLEAASLEEFLDVVREDAYGCFFG